MLCAHFFTLLDGSSSPSPTHGPAPAHANTRVISDQLLELVSNVFIFSLLYIETQNQTLKQS